MKWIIYGTIIITLVVISLYYHQDQLLVVQQQQQPQRDTVLRSGKSLAPLTDRIQLFAFADRIADRESELCTSIETALLSGWKYQLIGPTMYIARPKSASGRFDEKALKIFSLSLLMEALPPDVILVFADAMDVIFQRNASDFHAELMKSRFKDGSILFGAEKNCWPFSRTNKKTYHCPLMQGDTWKTDSKEPGLGCKLQDKVYESYQRSKPVSNSSSNGSSRSSNNRNGHNHSKSDIASSRKIGERPREERSIYLNSGLSVGVVSNYTKLVQKSNEMVKTLPHLCIDDQGLVAWQMVSSDQPSIALDYTSSLLGSLNDRKMRFDESDGLIKLWRYEQGSSSAGGGGSASASVSVSGSGGGGDAEASDAMVAPFMIHFNGNGKADNNYNLTRERLVRWRQKHATAPGGSSVRRFLEHEATLWVDGVEKKFADVCKRHVEARVKTLL